MDLVEMDRYKDQVLRRVSAFLAVKPRSEKEVTQKISSLINSLGASVPIQEDILLREVMTLLKERGLVDDRDYALTYVFEQKRKSKPKGPYYISKFLLQKGLEKSLINSVLLETYPLIEEINLIKRTVEGMSHKEPSRVVNYLKRCGFTSKAIYTVVDRYSKKA
ncbi:RecX family transcriptional regulator [Patescibacteria group bacterium]|nr:RecX family transcriptional regulator [Patescibacteria group bacterium]